MTEPLLAEEGPDRDSWTEDHTRPDADGLTLSACRAMPSGVTSGTRARLDTRGASSQIAFLLTLDGSLSEDAWKATSDRWFGPRAPAAEANLQGLEFCRGRQLTSATSVWSVDSEASDRRWREGPSLLDGFRLNGCPED